MSRPTSGLSIAVVGGLLAGLATARMLHGTGHEVTVFERAGAAFATRGGGLGINLALATAIADESALAHLYLSRRLLWRKGEAWTEACSEDVTAYGALWRWLAAGLPKLACTMAPKSLHCTTSTRRSRFNLPAARATATHS